MKRKTVVALLILAALAAAGVLAVATRVAGVDGDPDVALPWRRAT